MKAWKLERVLELQEKAGRTRRWLAEYIGINQTLLNHYLSGRRIPRRPVIKLIAQALDTSEEDLLGESANSLTSTGAKAAVG